MADEAPRISVSRDALRADLAEMELRLRVYFDDQLRHKADAASMISVIARVERIERGDFTDAQKGVIEKHIALALERRESKTWTNRERIMGLLSLVACVAVSYVTIRGGM